MEYFFEQLKSILGNRFGDFRDAYDNKPRARALRVNTLKISVEDFLRLVAEEEGAGKRLYSLRSNHLCPQSFYTTVKPSLDPLYHAGLYYMQEPSASAAVAAFAPYIGKRVLDLCAAPGGKSTQAASLMKGGTIFTNDVEYKRVNALTENIERLGITNAVVTHAKAANYRRAGLDGYFDTLIVDAPCSGGGMMRYEDVPYTREIVEGCAARQRALIDDAVELLAPGGYMLYSTCTFAPQEDEDNVRYIMNKGFEPVDIPLPDGVERGIDLPQARRIYPQNFDGEGHFFCVLRKTAGEQSDVRGEKLIMRAVKVGEEELSASEINGRLALFTGQMPRLRYCERGEGLNGCRAGAPVFELNSKDFSHALSHALDADKAGKIELGELAEKYLRGEQLALSSPKGMRIATYNGYALGWVRSAPSGDGSAALKNLYPKKLRLKNI